MVSIRGAVMAATQMMRSVKLSPLLLPHCSAAATAPAAVTSAAVATDAAAVVEIYEIAALP